MTNRKKPTKQVEPQEPINLENHITTIRYVFWQELGIQVQELGENRWAVSDSRLGAMSMRFRFPDGTNGGGMNFRSRAAAENEVRRIVKAMSQPLRKAQIRQALRAQLINREEQPEYLKKFKKHLLAAEYKKAAQIYDNYFSNWTRGLIPNHLVLQMRIQNKKRRNSELTKTK